MRSVKEPIKNVARRVLSDDSYDQLIGAYAKGLHLVEKYSIASLQNSRRLRRLRNRYPGRRCFIIANGPSLAQMDLTCLKSEITIGSNGLFLIFDTLGFLPTFYTVQDYLVAEGFAEQIQKVKGITKLFPRELEYCLASDTDTIYFDLLPDPRQRYLDKHKNDNFRPKFSDRLERGAFDGIGAIRVFPRRLAFRQFRDCGTHNGNQVAAKDHLTRRLDCLLHHRSRRVQPGAQHRHLRRPSRQVLFFDRLQHARQHHRRISRPRRIQHVTEPRPVGNSLAGEQLLFYAANGLVHRLQRPRTRCTQRTGEY